MSINTTNKNLNTYTNNDNIINSSVESCIINVIYSYVNVNYTAVINCPIYNNNEFILTYELLKKLEESIQINNFQIFCYNSVYESFTIN